MSFEIKAILERENDNNSCIYAYKDGNYWKIYEMSAYSLHKIMKRYKHTTYCMKELYEDIFYMSIQNSDIDKICKELDLHVSKDHFLQYYSPWISRNEYELWKYNFKMEKNNSDQFAPDDLTNKDIINNEVSNTLLLKLEDDENKSLSNSCDLDSLIKEIKKFPLELKTPVECMNWISEIKKMISSY